MRELVKEANINIAIVAENGAPVKCQCCGKKSVSNSKVTQLEVQVEN